MRLGYHYDTNQIFSENWQLNINNPHYKFVTQEHILVDNVHNIWLKSVLMDVICGVTELWNLEPVVICSHPLPVYFSCICIGL